jgi:hypothetical protein
MLIYTPLVLLCISRIASARRNVSLDDDDPSIVYHGNWLHTPYDRTNRGGHHMVTADDSAYATLAFTGTFIKALSQKPDFDNWIPGVAIYFYSPLWPFRVTTAVSLDRDKSELIDLRDYDVRFLQDGAETTRSEIIWSADGLENTSHTFNVSVGDGEDLAILDYLVYDSPFTHCPVPHTFFLVTPL